MLYDTNKLINKLITASKAKEEQTVLESTSNYRAKTQGVTVGKSDAIPPGYGLKQLKLNALPDGAVLPTGEYNAVVYMLFYDINSNERAMVNSQVPISLTIEN